MEQERTKRLEIVQTEIGTIVVKAPDGQYHDFRVFYGGAMLPFINGKMCHVPEKKYRELLKEFLMGEGQDYIIPSESEIARDMATVLNNDKAGYYTEVVPEPVVTESEPVVEEQPAQTETEETVQEQEEQKEEQVEKQSVNDEVNKKEAKTEDAQQEKTTQNDFSKSEPVQVEPVRPPQLMSREEIEHLTNSNLRPFGDHIKAPEESKATSSNDYKEEKLPPNALNDEIFNQMISLDDLLVSPKEDRQATDKQFTTPKNDVDARLDSLEEGFNKIYALLLEKQEEKKREEPKTELVVSEKINDTKELDRNELIKQAQQEFDNNKEAVEPVEEKIVSTDNNELLQEVKKANKKAKVLTVFAVLSLLFSVALGGLMSFFALTDYKSTLNLNSGDQVELHAVINNDNGTSDYVLIGSFSIENGVITFTGE